MMTYIARVMTNTFARIFGYGELLYKWWDYTGLDLRISYLNILMVYIHV